jgi:RNA polymerase sigma-70 factor (ECF subfamily)
MSVNEVIHKSLKHYDALLNFAHKLARNGSDAEDIVQTAYVKTLEYDKTLQPENMPGLLATIIRHETCNIYRRQKRIEYRKIKPEEIVLEPEKELDEEISAAFEKALGAVSQKALFYLFAVAEGKSYADIASSEGVSEGSVNTILHYARKSLRPLLEKAYKTCLQRASKKHDERLLWRTAVGY